MPAQHGFKLRCEWGLHGVQALQDHVDALVIVDVLSFGTCVSIATARGAAVLPFAWRDERAAAFAREHDAVLAGKRGESRYSLSPASLLQLPAGERLVLPSPNGATLCAAARPMPVYAGCLRNARAVARAASRHGPRIGVVPAGERWPDDALRPALEDWLGAGAVLQALPGRPSPEAELAVQAFLRWRNGGASLLEACVSARELLDRGHPEDVALAAALDADAVAPLLRDGMFTAAGEAP